MISLKYLISLHLVLFINFNQQGFSQPGSYAPPKSFEEAGESFAGLYPIGWSQNESFFAWVRHNTQTGEADPPEGYFFELIIQDIRNDKVVFIKKIHGNQFCKEEHCDFGLKTIWNIYGSTFAHKLNEYRIIQDESLKWIKFPVTLDEQTYSIRIEDKKADYETILSEKIYVINDQLGSKRIYDNTYKEFIEPLHSEIRGAFISPSSERFVIVKRSKYPGFEEEILLIPTLIGCHLTYGYK